MQVVLRPRGPVSNEKWIVSEHEHRAYVRNLLLNANVLMSGVRDLDVFDARAEIGRTTVYSSERWFKPWLGMLRLLKPSYFKMAYKFVRLLGMNEKLLYFPMGVHAARDMARLCGLMHGDLKCLFKAPMLDLA